ncbi:DUF5701 family protein [Mycobacteroides franklinii]|uniref:Uncharacterized protein n=1 Tax=Mycobacteroides franklinii TaxID=948102 RepID=A0A4R8R712_9MYCO|nr:DUF5701 family protein [Mycobacteroides franklinii]TDZ41847.1 hypothetical protein CCUG64054_01881 [Mycobacteroides franklinii]TDZ51995.1 hypothetical protein CCUG63697_00466 [Mycobacteroides franklinii]TDZ55402.1 hypothetical protein CCUG63696_01884 [Mycobacteroides franklinii]TDZ62343.1 hypothetical protein CCUG63695_01808 [Mycobacteroides franklinii]TDZ68740.1 hypothetical protein CCUG64056_01881 [Mycobacteroides franklinii]
MPAAQDEFDRQLAHLTERGYPVDDCAPELRTRVADLPSSAVDPDDHVPFVLVVPGISYEQTAPLMSINGRNGFHVMEDGDVDVYQPAVEIPTRAYLLSDIDTGSEFCNVTPEQAVQAITARGRTPLTIDEGIALVISRPDMLRKNKCFSLAASRGKGQRVPAIWISDRRPKLGWCWDRNPHTWLGTASCGGRVVA